MDFRKHRIENYWIPGHAHINVQDPAVDRFVRAATVHNFLFGQPFAISDSALVSCKALRDASVNDPVIRTLVELGFVRIARREAQGAERTALIDLCKRLLNDGRPEDYATDAFLDETTLRLFEDQAMVLPYKLADARVHYASEVIELLERSKDDLLPRSVAEVVINAAQSRLQETGTIDQAFLFYEKNVGQELARQFGTKEVWQKHGETIRQISTGPYISFLGEHFSLNPVFSRDQADAVAMWRGRVEAERVPVEAPVRLTRKLDTASFVDGILRFDFEELLKLRDSDAGIEFRSAMADLSLLEASRRRLKSAYQIYCRCLDDAVIHKVRTGQTPVEQELKLEILTPMERWVRAGKLVVVHLVVVASDIVAFNHKPVGAITHALSEVYKVIRGHDEIAEAINRTMLAHREEIAKRDVQAAEVEEALRSENTLLLDSVITARGNSLSDTLLDRAFMAKRG